MEATIKLDDALNLIRVHQEGLAKRVDSEIPGTRTHTALWNEYKAVSGLYDATRRLGK